MTDYRVTMTVKNARILRAMKKAGFDSVSALARSSGVPLGSLYMLVSMKRPPIVRGGKWSKAANAVALLLNVPVEKLFSPAQRSLSGMPTRKSIDVSEADLNAYISSASVAAPMLGESIENADLVNKLLAHAKLTPRESEVLRRRFYENETLEEVGADFCLNRERIRQIEAKALRKMKSSDALVLYRKANE